MFDQATELRMARLKNNYMVNVSMKETKFEKAFAM